jgi:hypothetical protein
MMEELFIEKTVKFAKKLKIVKPVLNGSLCATVTRSTPPSPTRRPNRANYPNRAKRLKVV